MAKLGFNFTPSTPDLIEDRSAYFAEYRIQLEAAKALVAGEVDEDEDDVETAVIVTEESQAIDAAELPTSARAIFAAADALGWRPRAWRTRTLHEATLYKSMTEAHNAGDVRWPAKEKRNYFLTGKLPAGRLGFTATWTGVDDPKKPAGQKTGSFLCATVFDPYGIPVELQASYAPSKYQNDTFGETKAERTAGSRAYEYNDGEEVDQLSRFMGSATEFSAWLDEWLTMLAPTHKKLSKKTKEKAPAVPIDQGIALIGNGEWSSE